MDYCINSLEGQTNFPDIIFNVARWRSYILINFDDFAFSFTNSWSVYASLSLYDIYYDINMYVNYCLIYKYNLLWYVGLS